MSSALEAGIERACKLLESPTPEAMEASAAALEIVARDLDARRGAIGAEEAQRLRAGVQRARLLLDLAGRFHARWRNILSAMSGGYTAQGAPVELSTRRRVSISG